ncbi:MAG: T9SS type A sorting domain-containing protein [Bacteroidota bacterium]
MRLIISLFFFGLLSQTVSAQTAIIGGDFENWQTDTLLEVFPPFQSSAALNYFELGLANVRATPNDQNGTAVRLETHLNDENEVTPAIFWLGDLGPAGLEGGIPCTAMPDSAYVRVRYDMQAADEFMLGWRFTQNNQQVALSLESFGGQDTNFHWIGIELANYSANPDKISFLIASSNLLPGSMNEVGSWVEIDSMYFSDANACMPNMSWETYTSLDFDEPEAWHTTNRYTQLLGHQKQAASQEMDPNLVYSGASSLKLETIDNGNSPFFDTTGYVWNGFGFDDAGFSGGQPLPASHPMPSNISGFYRYQAVGGADTALAYARFWYYDAMLDSTLEQESVIALPPSDSFRYFAIPLSLGFLPDSFSLIFAASDIDQILTQSEAGIGSSLWLDQLQIDGVNTIKSDIGPAIVFELYPNPTVDFVWLRFAERLSEPLQMQLIDLRGSVLRSSQIKNQNSKIALDAIPPGHYILQIQNQDGQQLATQKLVLLP